MFFSLSFFIYKHRTLPPIRGQSSSSRTERPGQGQAPRPAPQVRGRFQDCRPARPGLSWAKIAAQLGNRQGYCLPRPPGPSQKPTRADQASRPVARCFHASPAGAVSFPQRNPFGTAPDEWKAPGLQMDLGRKSGEPSCNLGGLKSRRCERTGSPLCSLAGRPFHDSNLIAPRVPSGLAVSRCRSLTVAFSGAPTPPVRCPLQSVVRSLQRQSPPGQEVSVLPSVASTHSNSPATSANPSLARGDSAI